MYLKEHREVIKRFGYQISNVPWTWARYYWVTMRGKLAADCNTLSRKGPRILDLSFSVFFNLSAHLQIILHTYIHIHIFYLNLGNSRRPKGCGSISSQNGRAGSSPWNRFKAPGSQRMANSETVCWYRSVFWQFPRNLIPCTYVHVWVNREICTCSIFPVRLCHIRAICSKVLHKSVNEIKPISHYIQAISLAAWLYFPSDLRYH